MTKLRIAYLSPFSPEDKKASSGTNFSIAKELQRIGTVEWIQVRETLVGKTIRALAKINNLILYKKIVAVVTKCYRKYGSKIISENSLDNYDVIIAFFCSYCIEYHINTNTPIVLISDATFSSLLDYYHSFSNLYKRNIKSGILMEQHVQDLCQRIILSSEWAVNSSISDYHQSKEKVKLIEFGANIESDNREIHKFTHSGNTKILFVGVEWERKGGDIACETVKWLNDNGIPAELHLIGIKRLPKKWQNYNYIINHGFLNKNIRTEYLTLTSILNSVDCLLLPTKAECSAIAFSEASANGLPIFTHDTGGISNYVYNGKNGYMLPLGSSGEDFGKKIKNAIKLDELPKMSQSARTIYHEKLNWRRWGREMVIILNELSNSND